MGGFVVNTKEPGLPDYVPEKWCLSETLDFSEYTGPSHPTLTANGVRMLAEHGRLPDNPAELLDNRSKAKGVAKALATLQGVWMINQCVGRITAHLPLTLLELHTLAHVACTLVMYLFWMKKPYDAIEPLVLDGEWVRPMCATFIMFTRMDYQSEDHRGIEYKFHAEIERLLFMESRLSDQDKLEFEDAAGSPLNNVFRRKHLIVLLGSDGDPEMNFNDSRILGQASSNENIVVNSGQSDDKPIANALSKVRVLNRATGTIHTSDAPGTHNTTLSLGFNDVLYDWGFGTNPSSIHLRTRHQSWTEGRVKHTKYYVPPDRIHVNVTTLVRWDLALTFMSEYPAIWNQKRLSAKNAGAPPDHSVWHYPDHLLKEPYIHTRSHFWPRKDLLGHNFSFYPNIAFSFATGAYAGIHAVAWNEYFPTNGERYFWRFSVLFIAGSGIMFGVFCSICALRNHLYSSAGDSRVFRCLWSFLDLSLGFLLGVGFFVPPLLYLVSRVYLVVESCYSLRRLPIDAYKTPRWTQYIPHL